MCNSGVALRLTGHITTSFCPKVHVIEVLMYRCHTTLNSKIFPLTHLPCHLFTCTCNTMSVLSRTLDTSSLPLSPHILLGKAYLMFVFRGRVAYLRDSCGTHHKYKQAQVQAIRLLHFGFFQ